MISKGVLFAVISVSAIMLGTTIAYIAFKQPAKTITANIGTEFSLYIGGSVIINDNGIRVKFLDVLTDSRCPKDVECIWEGTVSLLINIQFDNQDLGDFVLNSTNLHKASFMGYYVKFKVLEPYPVSTKTISKSSYLATFIVNTYGPD